MPASLRYLAKRRCHRPSAPLPNPPHSPTTTALDNGRNNLAASHKRNAPRPGFTPHLSEHCRMNPKWRSQIAGRLLGKVKALKYGCLYTEGPYTCLGVKGGASREVMQLPVNGPCGGRHGLTVCTPPVAPARGSLRRRACPSRPSCSLPTYAYMPRQRSQVNSPPWLSPRYGTWPSLGLTRSHPRPRCPPP
jgi:hypothetical protein